MYNKNNIYAKQRTSFIKLNFDLLSVRIKLWQTSLSILRKPSGLACMKYFVEI